MSLPELLKKSAEKLLSTYCSEHNFHCTDVPSRLSYRIGDNRVTLLEELSGCPCLSSCNARPVAQFRYQPDLTQWTLHYYNFNIIRSVIIHNS